MVVVKVLLGDSIGEPDAVRVFHDNSGKFELTEKKDKYLTMKST